MRRSAKTHVPRLPRLVAAARDLPAAERLPYSAHVAPHIVRLAGGEYLQVLRLAGASAESADDAAVNGRHTRLNILWRNIASPQVALWTHVLRRRERAYPPGRFPPGFAARVNERYRERLGRETLRVNELYLSLLYRPAPDAAQALTLRMLAGARAGGDALERADSLEACSKLAETVHAALEPYEPERLGCYVRGGRRGSSLLEFLGHLLNGEPQPMPLPRAPLNEALATSRLFFGTEILEYRTPSQMRWGAMLAIKEYPTPTAPGMLNALLAAPYPLLLTQSFTFVSRAAAQGLLTRQANRLANAGDFALSQAAALSQALDQLTSNEFVMGEHHLSLQVMTEPTEGAAERALARLEEDVAHARSLLANSGMTVAREDLALEAAFWAQFPGCFSWRPRKAVITSRNFAALAPFPNLPAGRADGNHWGEALALLATSARSPYYFSLHASDPREAGGGARRDTGHTFICGPTGSGKSVLIGFLVAMLVKAGATQILIDKDRGLELLVRALGGAYLPLRSGEPTGFNPLQLPETPANLEFLREWLRTLVRPHRAPSLTTPLTVRQEVDLDQALEGTLALPPPARRLSRLVEFLDATDAEGMHARLARWCAGGDAGWVFDNAHDAIAPLVAHTALVGFDVTAVLEAPRLRTPITLYLYHLVRTLLDGRRLVCWMDEFWRILEDAAFERLAKEGLKTARKLNGVMCFATQSPSDVLASPIARTIIEQTATQVFFANAAAGPEYREGFGLSPRELRLVREEMVPGARQFLLKQGTSSLVCALDLRGLEEELAVLAGRAETGALMERLRRAHGDPPERWLPTFLEAMRGASRPSPTTGTEGGDPPPCVR